MDRDLKLNRAKGIAVVISSHVKERREVQKDGVEAV